jgi:hypothetical protein
MNADDFLQEHAKWKYGKKKEAIPEEPRTWLMTESGAYFLLEGELDVKLKQLKENGLVCTIHENQTSIGMSHEQSKLERFRNG